MVRFGAYQARDAREAQARHLGTLRGVLIRGFCDTRGSHSLMEPKERIENSSRGRVCADKVLTNYLNHRKQGLRVG